MMIFPPCSSHNSGLMRIPASSMAWLTTTYTMAMTSISKASIPRQTRSGRCGSMTRPAKAANQRRLPNCLWRSRRRTEWSAPPGKISGRQCHLRRVFNGSRPYIGDESSLFASAGEPRGWLLRRTSGFLWLTKWVTIFFCAVQPTTAPVGAQACK